MGGMLGRNKHQEIRREGGRKEEGQKRKKGRKAGDTHGRARRGQDLRSRRQRGEARRGERARRGGARRGETRRGEARRRAVGRLGGWALLISFYTKSKLQYENASPQPFGSKPGPCRQNADMAERMPGTWRREPI